jgi:hypothetical protein
VSGLNDALGALFGEIPGRFHVGDIVCYTGTFLRNTGMTVGGPINGIVRRIERERGSPFDGWPYVQWSDDDEKEGRLVNPANIELDPTVRR